MIDPLTGQPVHVAVQAAHAVHQHHLMPANGGLAHTVSVEGEEPEDNKPAPHEAVIKSYADQVIMSNHKALVSQSQPVFTIASYASSVPQAGVPIQSQPTPLMVNQAHAAQLQLQAQLQAQAAQAQAVQLHNLQIQAAMQQQQQQQLALAQPGLHQFLVQQQLMQAAAAQQQHQLIQLSNGQIVVAAPQNPQNLMFQRYARPM